MRYYQLLFPALFTIAAPAYADDDKMESRKRPNEGSHLTPAYNDEFNKLLAERDRELQKAYDEYFKELGQANEAGTRKSDARSQEAYDEYEKKRRQIIAKYAEKLNKAGTGR